MRLGGGCAASTRHHPAGRTATTTPVGRQRPRRAISCLTPARGATVVRPVGREGGPGNFFDDDGGCDGRRATLPAILLPLDTGLLPLDTGCGQRLYAAKGAEGRVLWILSRGWIAIADAPGMVRCVSSSSDSVSSDAHNVGSGRKITDFLEKCVLVAEAYPHGAWGRDGRSVCS